MTNCKRPTGFKPRLACREQRISLGFRDDLHGAPPCGYIAGGIVVRIGNIATIFTTKAFPVSIPNMVVIRTDPGCIGRRYDKQLNTTLSGLVGQVLPQLIKTPAVQFCLLSFQWMPDRSCVYVNQTNVSFLLPGYTKAAY
jgi:hypothetical protein